MPAPGRTAWDRCLPWLALACVILSAAVFLRRGQAAFQAVSIAPGVALTSGFEDESMFAVWRAVHGQPVYADATRLPYASAYFNWLFYAAYALPAKAAMPLAGDAGIPLAGRLLTAAGALAGAAALGCTLRRIMGGHPLVAAALATFVFFGPLVGWWAHTLRPDVWALALETCALAVLLARHRTHPLAVSVFAALLFYGAWSCKQTYVLGLGTALLYLAWRRQWRPASLLAGASLGLWTATFLLLGPEYRAAILGMAANSAYYPALGLRNLVEMLAKSAPLWLLLAPLLFRRGAAAPPSTPADDARLLGTLGLVVSLPLGFAAGCKLGAGAYYYFTALVMLSLLAASLLAASASRRLFLPGLLAAAALQLLALLGHAGRTDLTEQTDRLGAIWPVWQKQPEPRFSTLTNLNLPWLNAGSPPLVLAFNYDADRAAGRTFEHGGLGGLIADGYFRTLLLPDGTPPEHDGGSLRRYRRGESVGGMTVYHFEPPPVP